MARDTYACHTASSGARSTPSGSTVPDTRPAHSAITDPVDSWRGWTASCLAGAPPATPISANAARTAVPPLPAAFRMCIRSPPAPLPPRGPWRFPHHAAGGAAWHSDGRGLAEAPRSAAPAPRRGAHQGREGKRDPRRNRDGATGVRGGSRRHRPLGPPWHGRTPEHVWHGEGLLPPRLKGFLRGLGGPSGRSSGNDRLPTPALTRDGPDVRAVSVVTAKVRCRGRC